MEVVSQLCPLIQLTLSQDVIAEHRLSVGVHIQPAAKAHTFPLVQLRQLPQKLLPLTDSALHTQLIFAAPVC